MLFAGAIRTRVRSATAPRAMAQLLSLEAAQRVCHVRPNAAMQVACLGSLWKGGRCDSQHDTFCFVSHTITSKCDAPCSDHTLAGEALYDFHLRSFEQVICGYYALYRIQCTKGCYTNFVVRHCV